MLKRVLVGLSLVLSISAFGQSSRNVAEYNLEAGTGLKGFDPVAVFPEGGSVAKKGSTQNRIIYKGVEYHFSTSKNLELFNQAPEKYEPTYGGWCAYAMASGSQVDIQPDLFTINGNRAHYFVSGRAKRNFDKEISKFENNADQAWRKISGEEPRL